MYFFSQCFCNSKIFGLDVLLMTDESCFLFTVLSLCSLCSVQLSVLHTHSFRSQGQVTSGQILRVLSRISNNIGMHYVRKMTSFMVPKSLVLLQMNGAAFFNLSMLTSDMWAVVIRIFIYKQKVTNFYHKFNNLHKINWIIKFVVNMFGKICFAG